MRNVKNAVKRAEFLSGLASYATVKQLAVRLGKSKSSLYRLRSRLVASGFLNSDYSITSKGFKLIESKALLCENVTKRNVIRLHNSAIVVGLAGRPFNWDSRREEWSVSRGGNKWRLASGVQTEVKLTDFTRVRTTPSSVIIFFGEVWADSPVDAKNKLFDYAAGAIRRVESELGVKLHSNWSLNFRTSQQEFALLKNEFAVELCKAGHKIRVEDMRGNARVIVDASLGWGELEAPNAVHGEQDALALKNLFEDTVVWGLSLREINQRVEALEGKQSPNNSNDSERREIS